MCFFPKLSFQVFYSWFFPEGFLYISQPIFLRERGFLPASLTLCTRGSCSFLFSNEYVQGLCARFNIQGPERCDDSEQGSYTELLLMRVYCRWFRISSYLPRLFCRCLSSPALIFHLNCRTLWILSKGVQLSSDLCDCHWIDLDWQEPKRFECWENHEDS